MNFLLNIFETQVSISVILMLEYDMKLIFQTLSINFWAFKLFEYS